MNDKKYTEKLEITILKALDEIAHHHDILGKSFDYVDKLAELSDLSHTNILNLLDKANILEEVKNNLQAVKMGKKDYIYNLDTDFSDFINYIKCGSTAKEKLQIFIMLYVVNCKLEELENWDLTRLLDYIKETDEYYYDDKEVIDMCVKEILECK